MNPDEFAKLQNTCKLPNIFRNFNVTLEKNLNDIDR